MKALSGITVLDLSRIIAGPYCTQILGDLGAEVLKVEQPGSGDPARGYGPPNIAEGADSAYFVALNRNKRSLTLNLHSSQGQAIARQLAAKSDVLIHNFKYGEAEKMGLDYAGLAQANPGLIYCTISAYGPEGPYRNRPGFDFLIQAQSGIMSLNGPAESPPTRVGPVAVVDITTGLFASNAILAALLARKLDPAGQGQQVEVSLFETAFAWLSNVTANYLITGQNPQRFGNKLSSVVPYQPFLCADGVEIVLAVATDSQFSRFCGLIGQAELARDPRFAKNGSRVKHRPELIKLLEEIFLSQPSGYWVELLINNDIPGGEINTLNRAFSDRHTQAIKLVEEITHPTVGNLKLVRSPLHLSKTPTSIERHPPLLGEHTTEVLKELGYSEQEQQALKEKGVI